MIEECVADLTKLMKQKYQKMLKIKTNQTRRRMITPVNTIQTPLTSVIHAP